MTTTMTTVMTHRHVWHYSKLNRLLDDNYTDYDSGYNYGVEFTECVLKG